MFSQGTFKHLRKKIYLSNSGFIPSVFGVFFLVIYAIMQSSTSVKL